MFKNNYNVNYIFTIFSILIIFVFNIILKFDNKHNLEKYVPDYKEKYDGLIKEYELLNESYTYIPVEVMNLSVSKMNNLIFINKGSNSNIKEKSFVVNSDGLIGLTTKVYPSFSVVKLINSKNINIAVEINDCFGTLKNTNGKSYVDDLINCSNVKVNDPVFTSKYSSSSSNILVGYINKITSDRLYIKYNFNPYKIKNLGVVYDNY